MNLRIFLLVFLLPTIIKAFEQSDIENENENKMERFDEFSALRDDEIEIPCTFAEAEASRICDCGYKNEVNFFMINLMIRKGVEFNHQKHCLLK